MENKIKKFFLCNLILLIFVFIVGCSQVRNIEIIGRGTVLVEGSITLKVSTTPENIDLDKIVWSTSDDLIATVDGGVVRGISIGEVTITALIGKARATHNVKVIYQTNQTIFAGINIETANPKVNKLLEFSLLERDFGYIRENFNPYNYNEINVYGIFSSPSGEEIKMPAFWYRDYEIILDTNHTGTSGISGVASTNPNEPQGLETVRWLSDDYHYRIRINPSEAGKWNYQIYAEEDGIIVQIVSGNFNVEECDQDYKGIIQVDKSNNRGFIYEDGSTFVPIGINLAWWTSSSRKTYDYEVWMENMSKNNMNFARIWMATWGFALHWGQQYDNFDDRLNSAARLDRVLEIADENNIYIMLTLINHGQFSSKTNPLWNQNPYNKANGGILDFPEQFFINVKAKETYKNELLYIIGRYGFSDRIMAWELWNEVNWTDNADINAFNINQWHREMGEFLKENDPYNHLVTTSYNYEEGPAYSLEVIDFANPHSYSYNNRNINTTLPVVQERLYNRYNKPILQSEIGINWQSGTQTANMDPNGISLRQAAWAGMMGGGAGGAMHWWWDSWVHPRDLYYQFKGVGEYAKWVDLSGEDYQQLRMLSNVTLSNNNLGILGYRFTNRIYGYIYDKNWTYLSASNPSYTNQHVNINLSNGLYELIFFNATTGEIISRTNIQITNNTFKVDIPTFSCDIAFIIKY